MPDQVTNSRSTRQAERLGEAHSSAKKSRMYGRSSHHALLSTWLAAELGGGFERRQIVARLRFLDDAGDFDVEQSHAGGGERRLGAREQRAVGGEWMQRLVGRPTGIGRRPTNS